MSVELFSNAAEVAKEVGPKMSEGFEKIKPEKEMSVKDISKGVKEEYDKAEAEKPSEPLDTDKNEKSDVTPNGEISEKPIVKIPCRNENLASDVHPDTKVPFVRKLIDLGAKVVDVVVPEFKSKFDVKLPEDAYTKNDKDQFKFCNEKLKDAVENDPELRDKFDSDQLEQIKNGDTPDGYTWHHDAEPGRMQLVDSETHQKTGHTGGRSIWGGGTASR